MSTEHSPTNHEINLYELWQTLVAQKLVILLVTTLFTAGATIYAWITNPVYTGDVLIEVGEVVINNETITILNLDNVNNLKEITMRATNTEIIIPNGTTNILRISTKNTDKAKIKLTLKNAVQFVLSRHQAKANLYHHDNAKISMTQVIRGIQVQNNPIEPKKILIISIGFVSGILLSIFGIFFQNFLTKLKTKINI